MNQHDVFLQEIIANPDDDGPRLIYADWLDEIGDPRGQFIRLQCEMEAYHPQSPRYWDLREAMWRLKVDTKRWEENLPIWAQKEAEPSYPTHGSVREYRRGFLYRLSVNPDDFVQNGEQIFERLPMPKVELAYLADGGKMFSQIRRPLGVHRLGLHFSNVEPDLSAIFTGLSREMLTELSMDTLSPSGVDRGPHPKLSDKDMRLLASFECLEQLKSLSLKFNRVGPEGLGYLVDSPRICNVQRLNLHGSLIGDAGLAKLARSRWASQLTDLNLVYTNTGDEGFLAFAQGEFPKLKSLSIKSELSESIFQAMAANESLSGLCDLDLMCSPTSGSHVGILAESPVFAGLRSLDLSFTILDDAGALALSRSPYMHNLHHLGIWATQVTAVGVKALVESPYVKNLTEISLGQGEQLDRVDGDEAAKAIARSPYVGELRSLSFCSMGIGDEGVAAIAASPHLSNLHNLSFSEVSNVGDQGAIALLKSPYLQNITRLYFYNSAISRHAAAALRERFGEAVELTQDFVG